MRTGQSSVSIDNPQRGERKDRNANVGRTDGYRYYLEDHPFLGPGLTLLLGGLCIYATIFSNGLRDLVLGRNADPTVANNFGMATGWMVAFVIGIMCITFIFLLINLGEVGVRRLRRKPLVCPACGVSEPKRGLRFKHERIKGTGWENATCSQCGNTWHARI